jgi:hypothetical protein
VHEKRLLYEHGPLLTVEKQLPGGCQQVVAARVLNRDSSLHEVQGVGHLNFEVQHLQNSIVKLNEVVVKHLSPLVEGKHAHRISGIATGCPHLCIVLSDIGRLRKTLDE